jgi:hypothetical protein
MPRASVWLIRTALAYLGTGFAIGALILFQKGVPYAGPVWQLLPLHNEFMLIGWTTQFAMGVAFWILSRFLHGAPITAIPYFAWDNRPAESPAQDWLRVWLKQEDWFQLRQPLDERDRQGWEHLLYRPLGPNL